MSELGILLGLIPYKPPKRTVSFVGKTNEERKDEALSRLRNVLRSGRVMSTYDIAHFMQIERATCAAYLAKLRDERGLVEEVGQTIHAGDTSLQLVWRMK